MEWKSEGKSSFFCFTGTVTKSVGQVRLSKFAKQYDSPEANKTAQLPFEKLRKPQHFYYIIKKQLCKYGFVRSFKLLPVTQKIFVKF